MSPAETSALMSIPVILISPSSIFFKSPLTMAESEVFANEHDLQREAYQAELDANKKAVTL